MCSEAMWDVSRDVDDLGGFGSVQVGHLHRVDYRKAGRWG